MTSEYVLNKLVDALNDLPDEDLVSLAALLRQPAADKTLAMLIENTLALREAERRSRTVSRKMPISPERHKAQLLGGNSKIISSHQRQIGSLKDVAGSLAKLLQDRNLFPSTKDVINAINGAFDLKINYEEFRKRGRRDLIQRCLSYVSELRESKQIDRLESFLKQIPQSRLEMDQYRSLFRILTRND